MTSISPTPIDDKPCFQCGHANPSAQNFCGGCGSPTALKDYIAARVGEEVSIAVRDRDILETESAIKVFERAWGWVKIVGSIAAVLLAILGGGILWKVSDWWSSVDKAKQAVSSSAADTRKSLNDVSARAVTDIQRASTNTTAANDDSAANARRLSGDLTKTAKRTTAELQGEAASVRGEVESSKVELAAVGKLRPEFEAMRTQLGSATAAIEAQQKVLASSEDFAKKIFSSHVVEEFSLATFMQPRSIVIPAPPGGTGQTIVFLLLPSSPIEGTLQLQYNIYVQPPHSYLYIHNLVVFFWGDPPDGLKQKLMSASYFPDTTDRDIIHAITVKDGRVYADDQPMPKFNEADLDFKGNKWIPIVGQSKP